MSDFNRDPPHRMWITFRTDKEGDWVSSSRFGPTPGLKKISHCYIRLSDHVMTKAESLEKAADELRAMAQDLRMGRTKL